MSQTGKSARAIDKVLRAHTGYPWVEFCQWPRGHYVILRCCGEPEGVFTQDPGRFDACPALDSNGLRAIFDLLDPGDLLRVEHSGHVTSISVNRTDEGTVRSMSLERTYLEVKNSCVPVIGLDFIKIMRELKLGARS